MKPKKRLSRREEFDILKLVLDKILFLGFAALAYGAWELTNSSGMQGFYVIIVGGVILLFFSFLLVKEFEIER